MSRSLAFPFYHSPRKLAHIFPLHVNSHLKVFPRKTLLSRCYVSFSLLFFFLTLRPSILYLLLLSCRILFYYAFFALLYFYSTTFERWGGSLIFRLVESTHFAITFLSALLFVLLAPLRLCGIFALKLRW